MSTAQSPTPSAPAIRLDGTGSLVFALAVAAVLVTIACFVVAAIDPDRVLSLIQAGVVTLGAMAFVGALPFFATVGPLELQVRFVVSSMLRVFVAAIGFVGGQFLAGPPPVVWMLTCFLGWAAMSALDARKMIRLGAGANPNPSNPSAYA